MTGSVSVAGGALRLTNRGHLSTLQEFVPSAALPIRISGRWASATLADSLHVVTRASAALDVPTGEVASGLQCNFFPMVNELRIRSHMGTHATVSVPFSLTDGVAFTMFDNGSTVTCTLINSRTGQRVSANATVTTAGASNFITLYNREFLGPNSVATIDSLSIEHGVTAPPTYQWDFDSVDAGTSYALTGPVDARLLSVTAGPANALFGDSVDLNGTTTSFVETSQAVAQLGTQPFTVSLWFKTSTNLPDAELFGNRDTASLGFFWSTRLQFGPSAQVNVEWYHPPTGAAAAFQLNQPAPYPLNQGRWHHLAITRRGTEGRLYVDGVLRGQGASVAPTNIGGVNPFALGHGSFIGANAFAGSFDDVRVYQGTDLTPCEVRTLASGFPLPAPSLPPTVTLNHGLKQLRFSWNVVPNAAWYELFEDTGTGMFNRVGPDISGTQFDLDVAVHLINWSTARYQLRACNTSGCSAFSNQPALPVNGVPLIGYFKPSTPTALYGISTGLSADGRTLAVGAFPGAWVYVKSPNGWVLEYSVPAPVPTAGRFGEGLALSADGNTLVVGDSVNDCRAYVYTRVGTVWAQVAGPLSFGSVLTCDFQQVAVDNAGANLVIGSYVVGARTFSKQADGGWGNPRVPPIAYVSGVGFGVSISGDGRTLVVGNRDENSSTTGINMPLSGSGAPRSGAAYVFTDSDGGWALEATIKPSVVTSSGFFGYRAAMSTNGNVLAIPASDATYLFTRNGSLWTQRASMPGGGSVALSADGSRLATSVADGSNSAGVGGPRNALLPNSNAVLIYGTSNAWATFAETAFVKARYPATGDLFGSWVSLSADGTTLAVGAMGEDRAGVGVNADPDAGASPNRGAVFLY